MKNTRETIQRHLSPWVIVIWLVLASVAALVDRTEFIERNHYEDMNE